MSDQTSSLTIRVGVAGVSSAMGDIQKLASGLTGAFSFATAQIDPTAIFNSIKGVLGFGSNLQNLHDRTGASVSSLVAIDIALSRIGESADGAAGMIAKMQKAVALAASGQDATAIKDFSLLGLDPKKLSQMDVAQQFMTIGKAIDSVANADQRASIAMNLLGRSGTELLAIFKDGKAMDTLAEGSGKFGQVIQRNAADWRDSLFDVHESSTAFERFWSGFLDMLPVKEISDKLLEVFESVDIVGWGQKFGALVTVVINSWKDEKFPEMLGLLIEAGFELGTEAVKTGWLALWQGLTGATAGQIYLSLVNAIISFGVKATQVLVDAFYYPVVAMEAGLIWLWGKMKSGFTEVVNFMKDAMQDWLNTVVDQWNKSLGKVFGKQLQPVQFQHDTPEKGPSFMEAWTGAKQDVSESSADVVNYLQQQLEKTREILGINSQLSATDNQHASAVSRLNALIDEQIKKRESARIEETKADAAPVVEPFDTKEFIAKQELALNTELLKIKRQLAQVESDYTKTNAEKYAEKAALLQKEIADYQAAIDQNNKLINSASVTPDEKLALSKRNEQLSSGLVNAQDSVSKMGADPNNFTAQFRQTITQLRDQWGTWATEMAGTFKTVFGSAVSSISQGITGLIEGTKTWGQTLQQIGTSILNSLIQKIVEMGVQFVLTHVIMRGAMMVTHAIGAALGWTQVATSNAQEAAKAPALAANASTASIGSYGASAIVGAIAAVAAIGLITAAALGAFAEGGYTGAGGKYEVAGLVHRGEVVWSQADVARAGGVSAVEAMRTGGVASAAPGNQTNLALHVWGADDAQKMQKHIQTNPAVRHAILDLVTKEVRWA